MPRLIDDIRAAGQTQVPWCVADSKLIHWQRHALQIWDVLRDPALPVILIDNVADYYFAVSDQENWDLATDFPNLAPPFEAAWFEHRMPRVIHSREKGDTNIAAMIPRGRVGLIMFGTTRENLVGEDIPDNLRWSVIFDFFIDYGTAVGSMGVQGPHGTVHIAVDADGRIIGEPWIQTFCEPGLEGPVRALITWCHPALLAISFLHCRNVRIVDEAVPKPLAKKYHARHGVWPARYKTLEIHPLKEILRHEGKSESTGLKHALHICRGHFRDYREGKGLFGKYKTVVWTPATVRGTKSGHEKPTREYEIKL